jgi:hypothetical protein
MQKEEHPPVREVCRQEFIQSSRQSDQHVADRRLTNVAILQIENVATFTTSSALT